MPRLKGPYIWEAHEYLHQEKTTDWYWGVAIVAVSAAIIAVVFGNILFALLIILGSFSMALYGSRKPDLVRFEINTSGILINKTLYPYNTLHSFWIEDNIHLEMHSKAIFKSKKIAVPLLIFPLEHIDPKELRDFLFDHLPEEEHQEPLSMKLLEYLGF